MTLALLRLLLLKRLGRDEPPTEVGGPGKGETISERELLPNRRPTSTGQVWPGVTQK